MNHYLTHLISNMHQAAGRVPQSPIPEGEFDPDYMLELEENAKNPMSQWFGLEKEQSPPLDCQTVEQLKLMANKF